MGKSSNERSSKIDIVSGLLTDLMGVIDQIFDVYTVQADIYSNSITVMKNSLTIVVKNNSSMESSKSEGA
jgi:hypothetical protein